MRWLFVIDPLEKLNISTDSTYAIMKESFNRDIEVYFCAINDLFFEKKAKAKASQFSGNKQKAAFLLDDFEMIFMRKEPPYDLAFHYATMILSLCNKPVVNNPKSLRVFNEKLILLNFPKLMPDTIVSSDENKIIEFVKKNKSAVIKLLDSYQGRFVYKLDKSEKNLKRLVKKLVLKNPVMVQKFLPNVVKGDKRILILGGKIIGAVNRVAKKGSYLSNFGQGGRGEKTSVTPNDKKIANEVSGFLLKNGIHFAGLDVIDSYLTEINITCPTGIVQINNLENKKLEKQIVDYFEKMIKYKKSINIQIP